MEGLELSFPQHGQQELGVHMLRLTIGTVAIGFAALAAAFDKGTWEHLPPSPKAADQATSGLEL
jgi:hypothetical protein